MIIYNGLFLVTVALLIVAGVCLGLLIALVVFTLGRRSSSPPLINDTPTPVDQSKRIAKRIASYTTAMTVGLMAIVFSATLVPVGQNPLFATILLVGGLVVVVLSLVQFRRI